MLGSSVGTECSVRDYSRLVRRLSRLCCIGLLMCSFLGVIAWGQQPAASADPIGGLRTGSLTVWYSDSSQASNWATVGRALAADFPQLQVNFRLVAAQDFIFELTSTAVHGSLPDVVLVDNWGQGAPLIESQSVVELLSPSRFPALRGTWFLMMQGAHPSTAFAFLHWLNDDPHWTAPQLSSSAISTIDREQITASALIALKKLGQDIKTNPAMDPDAALFDLPFTGTGCGNIVEMANHSVRFIFGNEKFAVTELTYEENARGGQVICSGLVHSFLVLRKRMNEWKVLYLMPRIPDISTASLVKGFSSLPYEKTQGRAPAVPSLITQQDAPQKLGTPAWYDISWNQNQPQPAAYIVERQVANPRGKDENWGQPSLTFVNPAQYGDVVSSTMIFAIGVPERWRVWAVGKDGQVALSEWRTVQFTN